MRDDNKKKMKCLQNKIYQILLDGRKIESCRDLLARRFNRWFTEDDAQYNADLSIKDLELLWGRVPPCVHYAVMNTWHNGWGPAKRFQITNKCTHIKIRKCTDNNLKKMHG